MHELTCVISNVAFNREGKPVVTFEMSERTSTLAMVDELSSNLLTLKVEKYSEKRSKNANAYMWKLCSLIADKLSEDGVPHTKNDVYKDAVRARGIYREQGDLPIDFANTSRHAWEMLGIAWVTEQVDFDQDGDRVTVRYYYGTSQYSKKQLGRVIDWLTDECRQLGIPTKSQAEIDSLLNSWGSKK